MSNNNWPNPVRPGVPVEPERDGLPSWEQCEAAVKCGDASPLQRFIYEHEPAGGDPDWGADVAWRALLAAAVEKARAEEREACAVVAFDHWMHRCVGISSPREMGARIEEAIRARGQA